MSSDLFLFPLLVHSLAVEDCADECVDVIAGFLLLDRRSMTDHHTADAREHLCEVVRIS